MNAIMTTDPDACLTRIEHALARIERASRTLRDGQAGHAARRSRTAAALAELDRVIARVAGEAR